MTNIEFLFKNMQQKLIVLLEMDFMKCEFVSRFCFPYV